MMTMPMAVVSVAAKAVTATAMATATVMAKATEMMMAAAGLHAEWLGGDAPPSSWWGLNTRGYVVEPGMCMYYV